MEEKSSVRVDRIHDVAVLDIRGYVTRLAREGIWKAYEDLDPQQDQKILLRFDEETFFNSEGLKVMLDLLSRCRQNGQRVGITGLSNHFIKIFHMVGIEKLATIYSTVKGALTALETK